MTQIPREPEISEEDKKKLQSLPKIKGIKPEYKPAQQANPIPREIEDLVNNHCFFSSAESTDKLKTKLTALLHQVEKRAVESFTKNKLVIGDFKCDIHGKLKTWEVEPCCPKCLSSERIKALTDVDNLGLLNDSDTWHEFYMAELKALEGSDERTKV